MISTISTSPSKSPKIQNLKINLRILATNIFLHTCKLKKVDWYKCSLCNKEIKTIEYILEECEFIQKFLQRDSTLLIVLEIYLFYVFVVFVETDIIVGFHEKKFRSSQIYYNLVWDAVERYRLWMGWYPQSRICMTQVNILLLKK